MNVLIATCCLSIAVPAVAQERDEAPADLKRLTLAELADLEVISASKRPEKLSEAASAIQVITSEDIRRSGASNLVEALRLLPNVNVGQVTAYAWVVTTRGFSNIFANKLLVMIDGRVVYTPLYAGVLWDAQNPPIENIDRIEVISGPGGTLWGANAVNGVVNVITKHTRDTKGFYASATAGTLIDDSGAMRFGGAAGSNVEWRAYAERFDRGRTLAANGRDHASDAWNLTQGGARLDWQMTEHDVLTLQGDAHDGVEKTAPAHSDLNGQNVLGRWTRTLSDTSDLTVQAYVDRTWRRDPPSTINDELVTTDVDVQHRFRWRSRHDVLWGGGYRLMFDDTPTGTPIVGFVPRKRTMRLGSVFVQDELALVPDRVRLTLGTKIEHNSFSGVEVQPSVRIAWTTTGGGTVWGAVSRAVRAPSRIDVDYHIPAQVIAIGTQGVNGGPDFDSEKEIAYEAGYRMQPVSTLSLSAATFYNTYDDLHTVESVNQTLTYQIMNGMRGKSWGFELSTAWQPVTWWRLRGGYTYFGKELRDKPGHVGDAAALGNDPAHQITYQSILDLPGGFQFDVVPRFVSALPAPVIARYAVADVRLAWTHTHFEIAIVGQNLGRDHHAEFTTQQVPRSAFARLTWRP